MKCWTDVGSSQSTQDMDGVASGKSNDDDGQRLVVLYLYSTRVQYTLPVHDVQ